MLDSLTSLAFAVQNGRGVYALLLGSGLSTAAGIPTGWDITLDLIRKSAAANNEDCGAEPASWFKTKTGHDADYSDLLDILAKTPADRANLLSSYFEPTPEDLANGLKAPTSAHKAIARLVAKGYVRVIVTTNFDRLLERALEAEGVSPALISTADAVRGALPLAHERCTVIKVHGDYRDTRIKNTVTELGNYEAEMDALLDRIVDEYGLIVCGWSATWDKALCRAVLRCPNRRFTTYWTRRATLSKQARALVTHRRALEVEIVSADAFFVELDRKIDAIERYSEPHPASAKLAVVSLKRFITKDQSRIELRDLVSSETERAFEQMSRISVAGGVVTIDLIFERMKIYENASAILIALFAHGGYWSQSQHHRIWSSSISRIAGLPRSSAVNTALFELRHYSVSLLFYSVGLGAIVAENYDLLKHLVRDSTLKRDGEERPLNRAALPSYALDYNIARQLPGYERHHTAMNDRVIEVLREPLREYLPADSDYDDAFDRFEYLVSLVHLDMRSDDKIPWAPVGRFGWRTRLEKRIEQVVSAEAQREGTNWDIIRSGLFPSIERFGEVEKIYSESILTPVRRQWLF